MIIYELECASGHRFEGWFPNAQAFESQRRGGLVNCAVCGMDEIFRVPAGGHFGNKAKGPIKQSKRSRRPPHKTVGSETTANVDPVTLLKMVDHFVKTRFKNVGKDFAKKATAIHEGRAKKEPIYGTATAEEQDILEEKGIPFSTIPKLPKSTEN